MKVEDALMSYAEEGNTERIKKVIKKGIDVNIKHKHYGYTPLHLASKNGHLGAMKVLLENGGMQMPGRIQVIPLCTWPPVMAMKMRFCCC